MPKFKLPNDMNLKGRSSTFNNAFALGIMPRINLTEERRRINPTIVEERLHALGMSSEHMSCAYCGGSYEVNDHYYPVVVDGRSTGYCTELNNTIPSCSSCNSKKSNKFPNVFFNEIIELSGNSEEVIERVQKILNVTNKYIPHLIDLNNLENELKHKYQEYLKMVEKLKVVISDLITLQTELRGLFTQQILND